MSSDRARSRCTTRSSCWAGSKKSWAPILLTVLSLLAHTGDARRLSQVAPGATVTPAGGATTAAAAPAVATPADVAATATAPVAAAPAIGAATAAAPVVATPAVGATTAAAPVVATPAVGTATAAAPVAATPAVGAATAAAPVVAAPAVGAATAPAAGTVAVPADAVVANPATAAGPTAAATPVATTATVTANPGNLNETLVAEQNASDAALDAEQAGAVPTLAQRNLTAMDGFVYDFSLLDVDYIPPLAALAHSNLTALPAAPAAVVSAIDLAVFTADRLTTWSLSILNANKQLWIDRANRKIKDAVTTLQEQADLFLDTPLFDVTNKSFLLAAQNGTGEPDTRMYFSLSDYYEPDKITVTNPEGTPYKYTPSVNLGVYEIAPNKRHLEDTIEHAMTLALAYFFTDQLKYATYARNKIVTWFLDPNIGMQPTLRGAGIINGVTRAGRPEGVYDMARLPDLLNAVALLQGSEAWSAADQTAFEAWLTAYTTFLETDPLAIYGRMMANYVGANVDEQLLASYIFLQNADKAAQIATYTTIRKDDQIVDGTLRYERQRQRSLDFTQQSMQSWVNIAKMSEKLNLNLWDDGLGEGHSVKDAFDRMRPSLETLGVSWPYEQVGTPRVRVAGQLTPRLYVAFSNPQQPNSGPSEYIELYETMWPTFSTTGAQARAIIDRLPHMVLNSQFAEEGIPLIEECDNLGCDSRTLSIWGITACLLLIVSFCLCWNCFIHWRADKATEVPEFLQKIRKQQAKYKAMNLKIEPAKPDYVMEMQAKQEAAKREEEESLLANKAQKDLRKEISALENKIARKRESKMTSQMAGSHMYGSGMPYYNPSLPGAPSAYSASHATQSVAGGGGSYFGSEASYAVATPMAGIHPLAGSWPNQNYQAQPIQEESGREFSFQPPNSDNDGSPYAGPMEPMSRDASGRASPSGNLSGPLSNTGASAPGMTALLAGAKEMLGEMGDGTTAPMSASFRK